MAQKRGILRLITAGSVDDGKSTLIGRLLHDSKSIYKNQIESIQRTSQAKGLKHIDFSLFTDGLKEEREKGITIDVAYRYFTTPKRKFILADCPGHIEYTRNMVTGASTANAAILLIDARNGIVEQTKRHSFILSLLQVKHLVVCINKMDLVDYKEEVFNAIVDEFESFTARLEIDDIRFIPISALHGENIVSVSNEMPWYTGSALLNTLESLSIASDRNLIDCRLPIQLALATDNSQPSFAGRIASGIFKKGDAVCTMDEDVTTKIKHIYVGNQEVEEAFPPMSVSVVLEQPTNLQRGDMLVRPKNKAAKTQDLDVMMCWLSETQFNPKANYILKHTTNESEAEVVEVVYKVNIDSLHRNLEEKSIEMNEIARVKLHSSKPMYVDKYQKNKSTGAIVLIDQHSKATVAAGMII